MKRKQLKRIILSSAFVLLLVVSFFSYMAINSLLTKNDDFEYSKPILQEVTQNTLSEDALEKQIVIKPFIAENVSQSIGFYDYSAEETEQAKSLIYFENTYMPSTGALYECNDEFNVISVLDGRVTKVNKDDILGNYIEITHDNNLITYYYSLNDISVKVDDEVKQGQMIGKSTSNKLSDKHSLFFEIYYQGKSINPNLSYDKKIDEL